MANLDKALVTCERHNQDRKFNNGGFFTLPEVSLGELEIIICSFLPLNLLKNL